MSAAVPDRKFARTLAAIVLAGLTFRLALHLATGTETYWIDGYTNYALLADSLADGHGYALPGGEATAARVPVYPLFIAVVTLGSGSAWALVVAQALVSSGTVLLAGLIARRMAGSLAGLFAAAVLAAWPYSAWHDVSLQETGLFACLSALATWLVIKSGEGRRWALGAGVALALAVLTRATILPYAVLVLVWLGWRAGGKRMLIALAAFALALSPWLAWSHNITGSVGFGTESGAQLYAGNHPLTFSSYPARSIDESRAVIFAAHTPGDRAELARLGGDEVAVDRWYRSQALGMIAADPAAFVHGSLRKLWAAFGPWPTPSHGFKRDTAYAAGWLPFLALALAGLWLRRRQWRDDLPLTLHIAAFVAVSALFWAQTAHRSAIDFVLAVFAGIALARLLPRLRAWGKGAA